MSFFVLRPTASDGGPSEGESSATRRGRGLVRRGLVSPTRPCAAPCSLRCGGGSCCVSERVPRASSAGSASRGGGGEEVGPCSRGLQSWQRASPFAGMTEASAAPRPAPFISLIEKQRSFGPSASSRGVPLAARGGAPARIAKDDCPREASFSKRQVPPKAEGEREEEVTYPKALSFSPSTRRAGASSASLRPDLAGRPFAPSRRAESSSKASATTETPLRRRAAKKREATSCPPSVLGSACAVAAPSSSRSSPLAGKTPHPPAEPSSDLRRRPPSSSGAKKAASSSAAQKTGCTPQSFVQAPCPELKRPLPSAEGEALFAATETRPLFCCRCGSPCLRGGGAATGGLSPKRGGESLARTRVPSHSPCASRKAGVGCAEETQTPWGGETRSSPDSSARPLQSTSVVETSRPLSSTTKPTPVLRADLPASPLQEQAPVRGVSSPKEALVSPRWESPEAAQTLAPRGPEMLASLSLQRRRHEEQMAKLRRQEREFEEKQLCLERLRPEARPQRAPWNDSVAKISPKKRSLPSDDNRGPRRPPPVKMTPEAAAASGAR